MRLIPSDPDIKTIVSRIDSGDIDLQPEFQRGEVWSDAKKQRLIDSILREWHVPPIHVIEVKDTAKQEVLDGQQRLVSIRDFVEGHIAVDGRTEPIDPTIQNLHGLTYANLPDHSRRKFDQFTIRVFRLIDYQPGEPGELFYRLNQPTNLTAAEQRNAFFGPARQQVKYLVQEFERRGGDKTFIGFSNSRMAYDDVIARLCASLECGTLREKITAGVLANRYRSDDGFDGAVFSEAEKAILLLADSRQHVHQQIKFNKATLYSWLWFAVGARKAANINSTWFGELLAYFESNRDHGPDDKEDVVLRALLGLYTDRSTSRVNDILSVLTRDLVIWFVFATHAGKTGKHIQPATAKIDILTRAAESIGAGHRVSSEEYVSQAIQLGWEAAK